MSEIVCFGAAHVDRFVVPQRSWMMGTSNPAEVRTGSGGVARNVAEIATRLGAAVSLVSRVGADREGDGIVADLRAMGIGTRHVGCSGTSPTAGYTALLTPAGELLVAFADMAIYDEITPAAVEPILREAAGARVWFLDANLPADTLAQIASVAPAPVLLAADAVSVEKSARLRACLPRLDCLFLNRDEAAALTGERGPPEAAVRILAGAGVRTVLLSLGAEGHAIGHRGQVRFAPALPAEVVNVTGAGDAFVAGVLHSLRAGADLDRCIRMGQAAAALALECEAAVPPGLTREAAETRMRLADEARR